MGVKAIDTAKLTKHCNETLLLATLLKRKKHGYELALAIEEQSGGYFTFNHGTLYPILHKLEKDDYITGTWKQEGPKRKRKYYRISRKGRKYIGQLIDEWRLFYTKFFEIAGDINHEPLQDSPHQIRSEARRSPAR